MTASWPCRRSPGVTRSRTTRTAACRYCVRGLLCGPHNFDLMGKFLVDLDDAIRYRDNPPAQAWHWEPGLEVGA
jgi:hypothetical protein